MLIATILVPPAPLAPGLATIITYLPGEARCGGRIATPVWVEPVIPAAPSGADGPQSITLDFRIDAGGRPLGIKWQARAPSRAWLESHDLQPSLATWRFAAGEERRDCTVTFTRNVIAVDEADPITAYSYAALAPMYFGHNPAVSRAILARARGEHSNCPQEPQAVRIVQPRFERLMPAPGRVSFTMLTYDVDIAGKPVDVQVVGSSGNDELERRSVDALRSSRYAPEARRNCARTFNLNPAIMPPPPAPPAGPFPAATCPAKDGPRWRIRPDLVFPDEFRRRRIEGWAIVRYDVTPAGDLTKVTAIAAEPASSFGEQAVRLLGRAVKEPVAGGRIACIDRVLFKMGSSPPR